MHLPGIPPDRIDSENSLDSGFAILTIDSFENLFGMPSGPGAECSFSVSMEVTFWPELFQQELKLENRA